MTPPNDVNRELAVLGSCLVWPSNTARVIESLDASDFYSPAHQRMFTVLRELYISGETIESSAVIDGIRKLGETDLSLVVSANSAAERDPLPAVRVVAAMSLRRRLLNESNELRKAAEDHAKDPATTLEDTRAHLAAIDTPLLAREPDDESFDEFYARSTARPTPWVLHGLIREGWRAIVVAPEGQGKTWLLRQVAVCAAYGIDPFRYGPTRPVRTLLLDLENPEDHLHGSFDRLLPLARRITASRDVKPEGRLWRRPGGIDLRKRSDRAELETLIQRRRPELFVCGPLYKLASPKASEPWEFVAREVQAILDDWRARFGLSLLLEDHAAKGIAGKRDLTPYGSSLWLRWPEIGLGLDPQRDGSLAVTRWRGDRMPTTWPDELRRGKPWPWVGRWNDGEEPA